ncbi:hotdog fold thioesterase [Salinibacillus xinjiangensis]|uniref:Hotdog fold thioesterase n=1 Tax=Salinibacillus xinjiangensis TaxID=1229268 RepID=A0A6G1X2I1_9BACI|nr:hotdog fold thioesterase [Salinibacillus xinjiangensis]MRG85207.1 hotdog fold thioesterase [Salinibacillus xinjiangensis]
MDVSDTLLEALDIEIVEVQPERVVLSMPVGPKTHQPLGFLHGGASVALAESAASIGGFLNVDANTQNVFGIEINANHIKSKRSGTVTGTATPIHIGKTTMVWEVKIVDEDEHLISISRCTLGVVTKK